jgi:hypothetical protein
MAMRSPARKESSSKKRTKKQAKIVCAQNTMGGAMLEYPFLQKFRLGRFNPDKALPQVANAPQQQDAD